jgi:eukaryotic-like serine/threonine-protein kinase
LLPTGAMIHSIPMAPEQTVTTTDTCPACGTVIDTTNADPLARVDCPNCGEKVRVQRAFNNFELVETLGIGGMGTVYKARDIQLDRLVALKLLRKDLAEEADYATRLQQEARVAASVNHPNVVQVFSSGQDHGQFYLVMELVDHGSLDDLIEQKKKLPEELVLEAGIQVAKGLRAAHGKGLIHRDVKPANILFADEHIAKIGDFGLAGVAAETGEAKGEIWGTPYYVAPERLYNRPEDFRSDMYSLGATLFHAISGRAPIEADTNSATALRDLKNRPLNLRTIAPEVSEETASVLQRTISPEPLKRYGSYDELVAALESAYASLTGKEYLLAERKSKMPWIIGVAVLMVALIGLGAWAYHLHQRNQAERQRSQIEMKKASERAAQLVATAPLEGRLAEAQRELSQVGFVNDASKCKEAFARIATDSRGKQPIYDWARLQQGLAAMVQSDKSAAQQAFKDIESTGETGFAKEDAELGRFFINTAKMLISPPPVPASSVNANPANYEALALLLAAVKDSEQLDIVNALPLLDKFMAAQPTGKFQWITDYKRLAKKYQDDAKLYADWKREAEEAKETAALEKHLRNTRSLKRSKKWQLHGALYDDVSAADKALDRQIKTDTASQAADQKNKANQAALEAAQKKPQWLADWKKRLMADLNGTHYSGALTVPAGGVQYTGITGATPDTLRMKTPYGEAQLQWNQLPAQTLLAISASFIKANQPDTADREWLCAVYAADNGLPNDAKRLAEAAAQGKPEYAQALAALNLSEKKPPLSPAPKGR